MKIEKVIIEAPNTRTQIYIKHSALVTFSLLDGRENGRLKGAI